MFVRWKKLLLRSDEFRADALCTHTGPMRYTLRPIVMESYRDDDSVPKHRVLWRPSKTIRSCCAKETVDTLARTEWWLYLWQDLEELQALSAKRSYKRLRPLAAKATYLIECMEDVVLIPTDGDLHLYAAWQQTETERQVGEGSLHCYQRRLEEAKQMAAASTQAEINPADLQDAANFLGLELPTHAEALKLAYRKAVMVHHPDRGGSATQFLRVQEAFEVLSSTITTPP